MEHLRTRWAALVVALLLILSVAGVAGAAHVVLPGSAASQAQEQVANEHEDGDQDEDQDEDTDEDTDEDVTEPEAEDTTQDTDGAQGEHGAIVSGVAQQKECIGGPNDNHGWAVSSVARGLLVPVVGACPVAPVPAAVTTDTDTDAAAAPGKSGEHRQDKAGKAKKAKHGRP